MIELCCEYLSVRYIWLYVLIMLRTRTCGFTLEHVCDMIRTSSQMHRTDSYSQHSSIIWRTWLNDWVFVYELSSCGFKSSCSHVNLDFVPASRKEFLDIQASIKYGFNLKRVRDLIRTYRQWNMIIKVFAGVWPWMSIRLLRPSLIKNQASSYKRYSCSERFWHCNIDDTAAR